MGDIPSAYDRMNNDTCPAFQWIGQSFAHCDGCGKPFWLHSHESRVVGGPFSGRWRHIPISTARAEGVRRKWGT